MFVEAAFPGVVGAGEEDGGGEGGGDAAVAGELLAVVEGEGVHEGGEGSEQVLDGAADQGGGLVGNCLSQRVLGAPVDERDDGAGMGLADDRVAFPVAGAPFVLDAGMELAAVGAVLMDAAVEPGEADGGVTGESQAPGDLLGAPVHAEQVADAVPEGWMELAGAGGGLSAALFGAGLGLLVAVAGGIGIAAEFAVDGGSVAVELVRAEAPCRCRAWIWQRSSRRSWW